METHSNELARYFLNTTGHLILHFMDLCERDVIGAMLRSAESIIVTHPAPTTVRDDLNMVKVDCVLPNDAHYSFDIPVAKWELDFLWSQITASVLSLRVDSDDVEPVHVGTYTKRAVEAGELKTRVAKVYGFYVNDNLTISDTSDEEIEIPIRFD